VEILGIAMAVGAIRGVDIRPALERTSRPALERVLALAPAPLRFGVAVVARLPASSRLRLWVLQEGFSRGFAAINRRDPWFISVAYEPDCEIYAAAEFRTLGLADFYRGHSGWREITDAIKDYLPDVRYTPEHVIDLGDRWVLRLGMSGSGRTSGVRTNQQWGSVYQLSSRGRIARQDIYLRWEPTLAAAGLRENR
jgi:SnoaL-like protein